MYLSSKFRWTVKLSDCLLALKNISQKSFVGMMLRASELFSLSIRACFVVLTARELISQLTSFSDIFILAVWLLTFEHKQMILFVIFSYHIR